MKALKFVDKHNIPIPSSITGYDIMYASCYNDDYEYDTLPVLETVTKDAVVNIAMRCRFLHGKWIIYDEQSELDKLWSKLVVLCLEGKLGRYIKLNLNSNICVYTDDFTNIDDVMRVRGMLRSLGIVRRIPYKPEIYTVYGIYHNNDYGIRSSIYYE